MLVHKHASESICSFFQTVLSSPTWDMMVLVEYTFISSFLRDSGHAKIKASVYCTLRKIPTKSQEK